MTDPLGGLDPTGPGGPIQEGRFGGLGRIFRRRQQSPVPGDVGPVESPSPATSQPQPVSQEPAERSAAPPRLGANRGPRVAPIAIVAALVLAGGIVPIVLGFAVDDAADDAIEGLRSNDAGVEVPDLPTPSTNAVGSNDTVPLAPAIDLFADATPALDAWGAALGGAVAAKQLVLYPDYGTLESEAGGSISRYLFRNGDVGAPTDVPLTPADDLASELFSFDQIDPAVVAQMVARAPTDTGSPGSEVSHIIIESDLPFADEIVIRVYVGNGRIDATLDGRIQEVFPST